MIQPRPQIDEISVYSQGKQVEELKSEKGLSDIVKMDSNENPFGHSPLAEKAIKKEMQELRSYPELTAPLLSKKLSDQLDVSQDQVLIGNGSDEVTRLLSRTYINEDDEAIMAEVTFHRYKTNVVIDGGVPVEIDMKHGKHDLDAMYGAINERTKMIFICNPNNPTGTIVEKEELQAFIEKVPPHILLVIDEAYFEYADSPQYLQTLPLLNKHKNMVILRTFSKVFGLAALRVGYGLMAPEIAGQLLKVKEPYSVNSFAQVAACASLDDDKFISESVNKNREGREYLIDQFERLELTYFPTQTNFIMVDVGAWTVDVHEHFLENGIIIQPGHLIGYPTMIRVTIGQRDENERFIKCLQAYLEKTYEPTSSSEQLKL